LQIAEFATPVTHRRFYSIRVKVMQWKIMSEKRQAPISRRCGGFYIESVL
jgi:hypothetical protein